MKISSIEIVTRDYEPETDDPYLYSTWTKYAWYSPVEPIKLPKKEWFANKIKEIKQMLSKDTVKIACFKGQPYVIAGYIVVCNGKIQWLCIKKDYHNQGIEKLLTQSMKEKIQNERS